MTPDDRTGIESIDIEEWNAQERARRAAARSGNDGTGPADARYRIVAEALRTLPRGAPPADFASGVLARVERHEAAAERRRTRRALAAMTLLWLALAVVYAGDWWPALRGQFDRGAAHWLLAGGACLLLSRLVRRRRASAGRTRASGRAL